MSNHEIKKPAKNYFIIPQGVSSDICQLLAEYVQLKADTKPCVRKNDALSGTHREYGDPLMETLLEHLLPVVEKTIGKALWPTLSFCYLYKKGHQLTLHTDRSSCEWVASLCIGFANDSEKGVGQWPLIVQSTDGIAQPVTLQVGDLVVFRGAKTPHWREPYEGAWYVSAIFAYVEKEGPYAYHKFDQRKRLGMPHVGMLRWSLGVLKASLAGYWKKQVF